MTGVADTAVVGGGVMRLGDHPAPFRSPRFLDKVTPRSAPTTRRSRKMAMENGMILVWYGKHRARGMATESGTRMVREMGLGRKIVRGYVSR